MTLDDMLAQIKAEKPDTASWSNAPAGFSDGIAPDLGPSHQYIAGLARRKASLDS